MKIIGRYIPSFVKNFSLTTNYITTKGMLELTSKYTACDVFLIDALGITYWML